MKAKHTGAIAAVFTIATSWTYQVKGESSPSEIKKPLAVTQGATARGEDVYREALTERAQELYDEAMKWYAKGEYAVAAALFERSDELDPAMGTQFRLADCYDKMRRWADAWSEFTAVALAAKAQGRSNGEAVARRRAAAIEPWIAFLVISVSSRGWSIQNVRITWDGKEVRRKKLESDTRISFAVDIGAHVLAITAPKKPPFQQAVKVEQAGSLIRVDLPPEVEARRAPPRVRRMSPIRVSPSLSVPWSRTCCDAAMISSVAAMVALSTGIAGFVLDDENLSVGAPLAIVGTLVGGTGLATSIWLWSRAFPSDKQSTSSVIEFVPAVTPAGAFGVVRVHF